MIYYSSLNSSKELGESFRCVRTSCKVFDCTKNILVKVNHIVRFILRHIRLQQTKNKQKTHLQHRYHTGKFSNELDMPRIPSIRARIPRRIILIDKVIPTNIHALVLTERYQDPITPTTANISLTFTNHPLRLIPILSHQPLDAPIILHQIQSLLLSPHHLHQTNSMRIHPPCILGQIRCIAYCTWKADSSLL